MRRLARPLALAGLVTVLCAAGASPAMAADECNGLMNCIPVAGPWVVVPASSNQTSAAQWQLKCPEGGIGGTDARVSELRVGVTFPGRTGAPVGPGTTVSNELVFEGRYSGTARRHATSFRPYIGCIPGGGGGQRTPTSAPGASPPAPLARVSARQPLKPAETIVVRTKTLALTAGSLARGSLTCDRGERLLHAGTAVGLQMNAIPGPSHLKAVHVVRTMQEDRILVSATRRGLASGIRAEVQIQAECAR